MKISEVNSVVEKSTAKIIEAAEVRADRSRMDPLDRAILTFTLWTVLTGISLPEA